ncbi:hypothetical protein GCM10009760_38290 [Kitasatospora kazusensis]|uniref:IrrE N-terminal-like domain-containing protein n=1 Tax=Kitasatospora kazusensis TaxID=407974 RepID=A0ABP5LHK3_9ACTN
MATGGAWQRRKLWRRCRRIADTLNVPTEFDAAVLADLVSSRLGRPVELVPLPSSTCSPCGVLVTTDRAEYIGYPRDTTPLHQQHIVLHEVGHLLCGHRGSTVLSPAVAAALAPSLSSELINRVLGRSVYTEVQEQEAEVFASLVLHRAADRRPAGRVAGPPPARPAGGFGPAGTTAARLGSLFDAAPPHGPSESV